MQIKRKQLKLYTFSAKVKEMQKGRQVDPAMHVKKTLEPMELDDQIVAVPVGELAKEYHGVIKLNETGAFLLEHLKEETTEEALVAALAKEYDGSPEQLSKDVHRYLALFREKGFLIG